MAAQHRTPNHPHDERTARVPDQPQHAPSLRGVKICCRGKIKVHQSEPFVSIDITRERQISLGSGSISPISVCLGMPIRFWKDPNFRFHHDPSNPDVAFMMMETDPFYESWGWAPGYWNRAIGSVLAVREDGQELAVNDMEMMCHFARNRLQPMFENVSELGSSVGGRQRVVDFITWDNVRSYWEQTGGE
ncbi:hypothetical protein N7541_002811 [Penicillium brevicompactum]|uniref:Uncharacterized protein n=1 Tax=Penicillium brevicompactum TaxID=5074 RepID=A0A9W9RKS3_PENBR|nr:hypothetical protein N7541_002811 [Penicillium brevicompactum]